MIDRRNRATACLAACLCALTAHSDPIVLHESWSGGGPEGWMTGYGAMNVSWTDTARDVGGLVGTFDEQGFPAPGFGGFLADENASGGRFAGAYTGTNGNILWIEFDFLAVGATPSDAWFRFRGVHDGLTNGFFTSIKSQMGPAGEWSRVRVLFDYRSGGWVPTNMPSAFSNALSNIRGIEVRVSRSATRAQSYVLDRLALARELPPEASTDDTDGDGMPDYWEQVHYGGPTNAVAGGDSDSDGTSNLAEYIAGTDPWEKGSFPRIDAMKWRGAAIDIGFDGFWNRQYGLDRRLSPLTGNWERMPMSVTGNLDYHWFTVTNDVPSRYYRLRVGLPGE